VVVHCLGGIGRSGTVLATVLIRLGFGPKRVIDYMTAVNIARGYRWPESDWHLEAIDRASR
jgi:protein-tyrosine phosphatase